VGALSPRRPPSRLGDPLLGYNRCLRQPRTNLPSVIPALNDAELFAPSLAAHLQRFTALKTLVLRGVDFAADAVQSIGSLQHLRCLVLAASLGLPAFLPTVLTQLPPRLRCLHLRGLRLPSGTVAAVLRHTGLSSLALSSEASALEDPHPLTALQHLTALDLGCGGWGPVAPVVPQPRQFPAGLARYDINRLVPLREPEEEFL